MSRFRTLEGTLLLDTVAGSIEEPARVRSLGSVARGTATVVPKAAAGS